MMFPDSRDASDNFGTAIRIRHGGIESFPMRWEEQARRRFGALVVWAAE